MATVTITADFGEDLDATTEFPNDGNDACGRVGSTSTRAVNRFPTTNIPAGATITKIELIMHTDGTQSPSGDTWRLGPYNSDGSGDPSADNAATAFSRCDLSSTSYTTTTNYRVGGPASYTDDITTANSLSHLTARKAASATYSVAIQQVDETGSNHFASFSEYTDGTASSRPQLKVTYTSGFWDVIGIGVTPA